MLSAHDLNFPYSAKASGDGMQVMEYADDNSRMEYKTKPSSHFCSVRSLPLANNALHCF